MTPAVAGDKVYGLGAGGELLCADAKSGSPLWNKNILQEFGGRGLGWGISESVLIDGNRIAGVVPHAGRNHTGRQVVDASNLTVMPGLVEFHSHLQKDFGEAAGRAWLAFGVTTVRSPATRPTRRSRIARRTKPAHARARACSARAI